ncbi:uncharacterized protein LOC126586359 isoform X2 [Malus sylvestris]|uniref:uncharacterized protein LOC126586359 isoform X2 n=1 Tax=Malus sylvestris TaxID=3752 RepID=UPI0021ABFD8B|nr:uncharacterized protein LOC126586359 isoform X2 [Malus sylvestris]
MASLRPTFSSTIPHFFKVILDDTSRDTKLKVPMKFVMKYGEELSSPVYLRLPCGSEWEIELRRCNGEVWFEKGWPEFSKFYSLDYAFWLVFGYEGNSRFHVFIFDRSCTEVDYPIKLPDKEKTDYEDDESVEILDDFPTSRRRKGERYSSLPCPLPPKKKGKSYSRMHPLTEKDKAIALQRAIAFKSEKPHFKVAMQPSYIFGNLVLPAGFAKRHLMHQPHGNAILRLPDGGTWCVKLKLYKQQKVRFKRGWLEFVRDNNLKTGDVCVFILIKGIELAFEVVFYRGTEAANCSLSPGGHAKGARAMDQVNWEIGTSGSRDPYAGKECSGGLNLETGYEDHDDKSFDILDDLCPRKSRDKSLVMPKLEETDKHDDDSNCDISRDSDEVQDDPTIPEEEETDYEDDDSVKILDDFSPCPRKTREKFPLPCLHKKMRTCSSSKAAECNTNFPATKTQPYEIKKSFRSKDSYCSKSEVKREGDFSTMKEVGGLSSSQIFRKRTLDVLGREHSLTKSEIALALQRANAFKSEYPSFPVAIQPAYIHSSYLGLPYEFVRTHLNKQRSSNVILQILDGSTWPVTFKYDATPRFQNGWSVFARENNLKVGDLCVFELVNHNELTFEVVFFRATEAKMCSSSAGHGGGAIDQVEIKRRSICKVKSGYENACTSEGCHEIPPTKGANHDPSGRRAFWPVNLIGYTNERRQMIISGGWLAFAEENSLRTGDVCTFELVETNDIVLKVHIFRS